MGRRHVHARAGPVRPADLEPAPVLLFDAAGASGRYRVQVLSTQNPQMPVEWTFEMAEKWQQYEIDLRSLSGCDVRGVTAIAFSAGSRGSFRLMLDNVRLAPPKGVSAEECQGPRKTALWRLDATPSDLWYVACPRGSVYRFQPRRCSALKIAV